MQAVIVFVLLVVLSPSLCFAETKTNENIILLSDMNPVEISIRDNKTNFMVTFDPSFVCPLGHQCEINLEIHDMTCSVKFGDADEDDPTYIIFLPIRTLDGRENFGHEDRDMICETFENENDDKVLKVLETFDLSSVQITPTGAKWESGDASVELIASLSITKIYILDASMKDLEFKITGTTPIHHQIYFDENNSDSCTTNFGSSCSLFGTLKQMACTQNSNYLEVTAYSKNGTKINTVEVCELTHRPLDAFKFEGPIGMIELLSIGDWESSGTFAVITFTYHLQVESGNCPSGYFSCNDCSNTFGHQGPTTCIPNAYLCDKRPHCGLPCYADESEDTCKNASNSNCSTEYHYIERYTNDLHNLYVSLVQIFFWSSALTIVVVLGIAFFFTYKVNSVGKQLAKTSEAQDDGGLFKNIEFLPTHYMTAIDNTEKSNVS